MIKFEGRVRKVEEKVRVRVRALDVSADVSTLEKACRDGRVPLEPILAKLLAKYKHNFDFIRNEILRRLSKETLHQIIGCCRKCSIRQPNL